MNLFFLKNSYSLVVTAFSKMSFILTSSVTLKVKTLSSIWKNFLKLALSSFSVWVLVYLVVSTFFVFM